MTTEKDVRLGFADTTGEERRRPAFCYWKGGAGC